MDVEQVKQAINVVKNHHTQLILLTGKYAHKLSIETVLSYGYPILNLGLELSKRLVNTPKNDRAKLVATIFTVLIGEQKEHVIILNHIEILFDKSLSVDPLKLLQSNARNITLVVIWPGERTPSALTYAAASHPEYRNYKTTVLGDCLVVDANRNY